MKMADQMDQEIKNQPHKEGLSDDQAMAAFSEFISNDEEVDPATL